MLLKNIVALGVAAVAITAPLAVADDAPSLKVGMAAPALTDVNWVKGEPVSAWEPGKVYVVDFWATWCGPCKASIPHFNELHNTYKDKGATFIGVAIWPTKTMQPTAEYVEAKGNDMAYHVAEDVDLKTANAFMTASGQAGIPTVMVVDQKGNIAWIGHPMAGLDDVIPAVLKGDFDGPKFAAEQQAQAEKRDALMSAMQTAVDASDWPGVRQAAENLTAFDPKEYGTLGGMYKYVALIKEKNAAGAAAWGQEFVNNIIGSDAESLNMFAWALVQPDGPLEAGEVDAKLAVLAAEKADNLLGNKDANTLDTLARAYFLAGDFAKAVATEEKALSVADNDDMKQAFQESLNEYKAKAGNG